MTEIQTYARRAEAQEAVSEIREARAAVAPGLAPLDPDRGGGGRPGEGLRRPGLPGPFRMRVRSGAELVVATVEGAS